MIKEYIDRGEAIIKLLQDGCSAKNVESIMNIHAADVVPVVRCKDCVAYRVNQWDTESGKVCKYWSDWIYIEPDDFCSYGERMDDDGN